jgi:hypothetical protein
MWFYNSLRFRARRVAGLLSGFAAFFRSLNVLVTWSMDRCTCSYKHDGPSTSIGPGASTGQKGQSGI